MQKKSQRTALFLILVSFLVTFVQMKRFVKKNFFAKPTLNSIVSNVTYGRSVPVMKTKIFFGGYSPLTQSDALSKWLQYGKENQ